MVVILRRLIVSKVQISREVMGTMHKLTRSQTVFFRLYHTDTRIEYGKARSRWSSAVKDSRRTVEIQVMQFPCR